MVTEERLSKQERLKKLVRINKKASQEKVEQALTTIEALEEIGLTRRGYNLRPPTDTRHTHHAADSSEQLDLSRAHNTRS